MADMAYAQTTASTAAPAAAAGAPASMMANVISFAPFIVIMVMFYFLMIVPQNKEKKKRETMLNGIVRGDKVLTRGGIYGTVADIKENILTLKISDNTKVEVEVSFIENVVKA